MFLMISDLLDLKDLFFYYVNYIGYHHYVSTSNNVICNL